ncbi:PAS domain S-box protein [Nostoc sp. FACHB-152]|uniref:PAS domain-containing sensor histidine kinase n=1 Tax=unclassified Nostoc TaxID=2593658 RepID=UPI001687511D|nr:MULTISPECIES: PAS domain S-box protein [unclassified Nostoc]MBD2449908.1 PAS domain S-box protein [Nostoc sp. FACHB-152]MBD2471368.1 PAS domain S-box protein [Nostoc sp. FACHB-145]
MYNKSLEEEILFLRQENAILKQKIAKSTSEFQAEIAKLEQKLQASQLQLESNTSQAELLAMFNAIEDVILVVDAEGRYLKIAPSCAPSLYKPSAAILGKTGHEVLPPDLADSFLDCIQQVLKTKKTVKIEYSLPLGNQEVWFEASVAVMNENTVVWAARDINDRKATEAALRQQEAQYRSIFETVNDGISVVDLDTGKIVAANPAFCQMHGYTQEEFSYLNPTAFVHPNSFSQFGEFINTIKMGGEFHTQSVDIHKDGTYFDIEVTGKLFDYNGKPHALSVVRNISERKQAEKEQRRLLAILEATTDIVGMADADGNSCYLNQAGQKILNIPASETNKFHISEVSISDNFQTEIMPTVIKEGIWSGESIFCSRTGEAFPVSQVIIAHRNEQGEIEFFSTIARDIRDRQQIEVQLRQQAEDLAQTLEELQRTQAQMIQAEKMSSLGELVAGVAHEINNPVNFIHGNLSHLEEHTQDLLRVINLYRSNNLPEFEMLCEEIDLEYIQEDLPKILRSMKVGTQRIRQIVLSLRTFSRMDEAEFKAVDIHEGIDSTLMILQHRLKEKPQFPEIQVIKEYTSLPLVECYAGQLNQVFMNILANAIDALEVGIGKDKLPTITITTSVIDVNWIKIAIADNGMGMPEQVKQRIFNPFFTTKPIGKGTGMGLSISYQIITEKHAGKLECHSKPGQGTEFVIKIPIQQVGLQIS